MTKKDIIKAIANKHSVTNAQAQSIVDDVIGIIADTVASGETVTITGFGTFKRVHRGSKSCINPRTGERMELSDYYTVVYKAGKPIKAKCNK